MFLENPGKVFSRDQLLDKIWGDVNVEVRTVDVHIRRLRKNININNKLKIAWDIGNGAMGLVIKEITSQLQNTHNILINEKVDGTFPNHHPDPTVPKNMEQLIKTVINYKCDIGFAFDGDGDRLGVVDNKGKIIWADQYMLILCSEITKLYDQPKIIMDVKCSKVFFDEAKKMNCDPIMARTGHSPIKEKMKELNSPLSGEMSGHVCYADDFYGYDDAIYVAARICQTLSRSNKTLSEMKAELPVYHSTPEMRLEAENDEEKFRIANEAVEFFTANYDCSTVDGVRIRFGDGWGLVRSSNTQPVIVCRFEANTFERMEEIKDLVLGKLREIGTLRDDVGH